MGTFSWSLHWPQTQKWGIGHSNLIFLFCAHSVFLSHIFTSIQMHFSHCFTVSISFQIPTINKNYTHNYGLCLLDDGLRRYVIPGFPAFLAVRINETELSKLQNSPKDFCLYTVYLDWVNVKLPCSLGHKSTIILTFIFFYIFIQDIITYFLV